jgi:enamine deaminase RidA (YjgF/YER057c/UK114 family)
MVKIEQRLQELEITLPPAPKAAANYKPCNQVGDLLYLSGHIPIQNDGVSLIKGKVSAGASAAGGMMTVEQGYAAARQVGLNLLATIKNECSRQNGNGNGNGDGDLDNVLQIVKLFGIVHSSHDFYEQHLVMNGCSDLFIEVFGQDIGCHARSAIGANALPLGVAVEVEAIVRVKTSNNGMPAK